MRTRERERLARAKWDDFVKNRQGLYVPNRRKSQLTAREERLELIAMAARLNARWAAGYQRLLAWQEAAGTLFATYTTAKSVINPTALITVPGGSDFWRPGKRLRISAQIALSNIVTTPGLFNWQVKIGTVAAFDTGNMQLNATAHTTLPCWLDIIMTVRATGSGTSANLMGLANLNGIMLTRTAGQTDDVQGSQNILAPATAPVVGAGFDSTIANIIDNFVGFTISNAGNGVRVDQYALYEEN